MTGRMYFETSPASAAEFSQLWSTHVDALERHLSAKLWALAAVPVVLTVYPIARIIIPALLHVVVVPDVVRTVLNLM